MNIDIDTLIEMCESLLKTAKELKEQQKPDPLVGCYKHAYNWATSAMSHAYFDGKYGYRVFKNGSKEKVEDWDRASVKHWIDCGYWVKIEEPKPARKFMHKSGAFDRLCGNPFKYIEVKNGKFYKVLKNGYRKEIVGCICNIEEIDGFVDDGDWIEVK